MDRLRELVRLHRKGLPVRKIATVLAMGPGTERKYREALRAAGVLEGDPSELPKLTELRAIVEAAHPRRHPPQERSTAEPYRAEIAAMVTLGAQPRAIFDKLRLEDPERDVSYHAVKRLCRRLRKVRPVRAQDVAQRPGRVGVSGGHEALQGVRARRRPSRDPLDHPHRGRLDRGVLGLVGWRGRRRATARRRARRRRHPPRRPQRGRVPGLSRGPGELHAGLQRDPVAAADPRGPA